MITYTVEAWDDIKDEVKPLLQRHWEEVALDRDTIPLAVDWDSYDVLAAQGVLHLLIARKDGVMIGYYWAIVRTHLHYVETLFAFTDILFIEKQHRRGMVGVNLFREMERTLKELGVQKIFAATKTKLDLGPIFKRLGYTVHEVVYSKMIG